MKRSDRSVVTTAPALATPRPSARPGPDPHERSWSVDEPLPEPIDNDRLAGLYAVHMPDALRFAYALCADRAEAEDVAQDAFARAASRFNALRSPDAFGAYLRRSIANVARSRARSADRDHRRRERHAHLSELDRPSEPSGLDADDDLWRAVQALPDRQRVAVVCRYWLDLPERETARVLGCRPGTVKSLLSRALDTLRKDMTDG